MNQHEIPEGKDPQLWQLAHKRAAFKRSLASYLAFSVFFWLIWYFTGSHSNRGIPWPVWPMLGWGIGIFFQYVNAYVSTGDRSIQREYENLSQQESPKK